MARQVGTCGLDDTMAKSIAWARRLNPLELEGTWLWVFHFFLAALYGGFLFLVAQTVAVKLYGIGFSAILETLSVICVGLSAVLLWSLLRRAAKVNPRSALRSMLEDNRNTIAELLQLNENLEAEICSRSEELNALNKRFGIATEKFKISAFQCDRQNRYLWAMNYLLSEDTIVGRTDYEIMPENEAEKLMSAKNRAMASDEIQDVEISLFVNGVLQSYDIKVAGIRDVRGDVVGTTMISLDITDKVEARNRLMTLMREVNHRAGNSLAIVASICALSSRCANSLSEFVSILSGRINSLAKSTHSLSADSWQGTDCAKIVVDQLTTLPTALKFRVKINSSPLILLPKAVQTIGLVVHELSNEVKSSGALTETSGQVVISWYVEGEGNDSEFVFQWTVESEDCRASMISDDFRRLFLERISGGELSGRSKIYDTPTGWCFELRGKANYSVHSGDIVKDECVATFMALAEQSRAA